MEFDVRARDEQPEQLEGIEVSSESGIVILPVYSPLSEEPEEPVDAKEAANIEKIWGQNEIICTKIEGRGTLVQFSDATTLPPLYLTLEFLANNPEMLVIALELLYSYYSRRTSDDVELEMTVESDEEVTSMKYSGSAEGIKEVPQKVFNQLGIEIEEEEEND